MQRKIVFSFDKKIYRSTLYLAIDVDLYILNQMGKKYIYKARCLWIRTYLSMYVRLVLYEWLIT